MPWRHWNDPVERIMVMPSFVIGEFFFITLALVTLVHAAAQGRTHLLVWLAALTTGTANDAIFMFLPFVDNFWQAQACVMLTPRMQVSGPTCARQRRSLLRRRLRFRGLCLFYQV